MVQPFVNFFLNFLNQLKSIFFSLAFFFLVFYSKHYFDGNKKCTMAKFIRFEGRIRISNEMTMKLLIRKVIGTINSRLTEKLCYILDMEQ